MTDTGADLIIEGRIATLHAAAGLTWVEALAVGDGRVVAAGSATDVLAVAGVETTIWRLPTEQIVTPSITDSHPHLAEAALAAGRPNLTGLDRAAASEVVTEAHQHLLEAGDPDGWLLGHGWSFDALGEHPDATWLDEAAPGRPVALWAHDHHSRWLSARAVQLTGLAAHVDPPSGHIERHADGRPTGVMYEAAAGLVDAAIPTPTAGDIDWAIGAYAHTLAELGVTAVHDPGALAPDPDLSGGAVHYRVMARAGRLPLRVIASVRQEQLSRAIEIGFRSGRPFDADGDGPEGADAPEPGGQGRYRDGWLKLFSDGALGSRTAALLAPYELDDPAGQPPGGPTGMALLPRAQLVELAGRAAAAGISSEIHAIGDAAVRSALDAIGTLPAVPGAMHRVEHAQLVHPDDIERFAALGVAASVQPSHLLSDADAMRAAWGARTASAFPLAGLERHGTLMPFGTDAPVEAADPWPGIAAAVTRRGQDWSAGTAFVPEQAISLERALRGACLDGPRSAHIDDQGHLAVGARADLLVLPAAAFDCPLEAELLATIRPLATLLDGAVVHQVPDFDP